MTSGHPEVDMPIVNAALADALGQVALAATTVESNRPDDDSDDMTRLRRALEFLDTIYPGPLEGVAGALEEE
jgi:hypothetical protein